MPNHQRTAGGARQYNPMESHLKRQIDRSLGGNHSPVHSDTGEAHLGRPQPAQSCRLEELGLGRIRACSGSMRGFSSVAGAPA